MWFKIYSNLNILDLSRLVASSKGLNAATTTVPNWSKAVSYLSEYAHILANGRVPLGADPRLSPSWAGLSVYRQFGALFPFVQRCAQNLNQFFDLDNATKDVLGMTVLTREAGLEEDDG